MNAQPTFPPHLLKTWIGLHHNADWKLAEDGMRLMCEHGFTPSFRGGSDDEVGGPHFQRLGGEGQEMAILSVNRLKSGQFGQFNLAWTLERLIKPADIEATVERHISKIQEAAGPALLVLNLTQAWLEQGGPANAMLVVMNFAKKPGLLAPRTIYARSEDEYRDKMNQKVELAHLGMHVALTEDGTYELMAIARG